MRQKKKAKRISGSARKKEKNLLQHKTILIDLLLHKTEDHFLYSVVLLMLESD